MTKVNPKNKNEAKSDIFSWHIFKSDTIHFFYQNILKYFNDFQNQNVNPKNKNEAKSDIFP